MDMSYVICVEAKLEPLFPEIPVAAEEILTGNIHNGMMGPLQRKPRNC